ncbi:unnamed protein product [Zymoseptoria tritici ST99CH_3D1]|nr:unnamed protein product [Zymoseptoria tritici ST99CH_3D1]
MPTDLTPSKRKAKEPATPVSRKKKAKGESSKSKKKARSEEVAQKLRERYKRTWNVDTCKNKWNKLKKAYTPYANHLKHISGWNGYPAEPADQEVADIHYAAHPECEPFKHGCPPFSEQIHAIIGTDVATGEYSTTGASLAEQTDEEGGVDADDDVELPWSESENEQTEDRVDSTAVDSTAVDSTEVIGDGDSDLEEIAGSAQILRAAQLAKENKARTKAAKRVNNSSLKDGELHFKALSKMITPFNQTVANLAKQQERFQELQMQREKERLKKPRERSELEIVSERIHDKAVLVGISDDDKDLLLLALAGQPSAATIAIGFLKEARFETFFRTMLRRIRGPTPPINVYHNTATYQTNQYAPQAQAQAHGQMMLPVAQGGLHGRC